MSWEPAISQSLQQHGGRNRLPLDAAEAKALIQEVRETMGEAVADAPALVPTQVVPSAGV